MSSNALQDEGQGEVAQAFKNFRTLERLSLMLKKEIAK